MVLLDRIQADSVETIKALLPWNMNKYYPTML